MFVFKKKDILVATGFLALIIGFSAIFIGNAEKKQAGSVNYGYKVVIDVGHGGIDSGVTGSVTGVKESDLNLAVSKKLATILSEAGITAVLTRNTEAGLYGAATGNLKKKEMLKRKEIILKEKPDLMVSIHMNKFSSPRRRGAQVFFKKGDMVSENLAFCMQKSVNNLYDGVKDYSALTGDYYVLNCSDYPSVLVECGFLSSPEDEKLLITEEFQEKTAYYIFCGIVKYLNSPLPSET